VYALMTKTERKKLYRLIEEWTRYEITARYAPVGWPDFGDYFAEKLRKEDEIRKLMFGTDSLMQLGERWGMKGCRRKSKKKRKVIRGKRSK